MNNSSNKENEKSYTHNYVSDKSKLKEFLDEIKNNTLHKASDYDNLLEKITKNIDSFSNSHTNNNDISQKLKQFNSNKNNNNNTSISKVNETNQKSSNSKNRSNSSSKNKKQNLNLNTINSNSKKETSINKNYKSNQNKNSVLNNLNNKNSNSNINSKNNKNSELNNIIIEQKQKEENLFEIKNNNIKNKAESESLYHFPSTFGNSLQNLGESSSKPNIATYMNSIINKEDNLSPIIQNKNISEFLSNNKFINTELKSTRKSNQIYKNSNEKANSHDADTNYLNNDTNAINHDIAEDLPIETPKNKKAKKINNENSQESKRYEITANNQNPNMSNSKNQTRNPGYSGKTSKNEESNSKYNSGKNKLIVKDERNVFTLSKLNDTECNPVNENKIFEYFDIQEENYYQEDQEIPTSQYGEDQAAANSNFFQKESNSKNLFSKKIPNGHINTKNKNQDEILENNNLNNINTESNENDIILNHSNDLKDKITQLNLSMRLKKSDSKNFRASINDQNDKNFRRSINNLSNINPSRQTFTYSKAKLNSTTNLNNIITSSSNNRNNTARSRNTHEQAGEKAQSQQGSSKDLIYNQRHANFNNNYTYHNSSYANNEPSIYKQEKIFDQTEIMFLIKNAKSLEKVLADSGPIEKIEDFEKKLQANANIVENLQSTSNDIMHDKMEIEIKIKELKGLINHYNDRFNKVEKYIDKENSSKFNRNVTSTDSKAALAYKNKSAEKVKLNSSKYNGQYNTNNNRMSKTFIAKNKNGLFTSSEKKINKQRKKNKLNLGSRDNNNINTENSSSKNKFKGNNLIEEKPSEQLRRKNTENNKSLALNKQKPELSKQKLNGQKKIQTKNFNKNNTDSKPIKSRTSSHYSNDLSVADEREKTEKHIFKSEENLQSPNLQNNVLELRLNIRKAHNEDIYEKNSSWDLINIDENYDNNIAFKEKVFSNKKSPLLADEIYNNSEMSKTIQGTTSKNNFNNNSKNQANLYEKINNKSKPSKQTEETYKKIDAKEFNRNKDKNLKDQKSRLTPSNSAQKSPLRANQKDFGEEDYEENNYKDLKQSTMQNDNSKINNKTDYLSKTYRSNLRSTKYDSEIFHNSNKLNNTTYESHQNNNFNENILSTYNNIYKNKSLSKTQKILYELEVLRNKNNRNEDFHNQIKNSETQKFKNKLPNANSYLEENNSNTDASCNNNNTYDPNRFIKISFDDSKQINKLFAEEKISEAIELWKKYDYCLFEGMSLDRSYEMMYQITKIKDRDIDKLIKKVDKLLKIKSENSKKDTEIIELVAEVEGLKYKLSEMEIQMHKNKVVQTQMTEIQSENSALFKENIKLRRLLEQERYFNSRVEEKKFIN